MKLCLVLLVTALSLRCQGRDLTQALLSIQDAIEANELDTASRLIEASLKEHPAEPGLLNLRGIVHARRDQLREARQDFAEAARLSPSLVPAWQNLARACQLEIDEDTSALSCAIDSWKHVLRTKPDDVEAYASLALLHEKQGNFAASLLEIQKLPAEQASHVRNVILRSVDLSALGRVEEAKGLASRLVTRTDFSESDLDSLASALDSPKAAPIAVILIEGLDARHAASLPSLRRLAIAYEQVQRPSDARKTLERLAVLDPTNTAHLLELARLADRMKDYEGALGYLGHARDLAPNDPQIHFLFATIAMKMNLPVEARKSLEQALALDPENPAYNYAMGSVMLTMRGAINAPSYFQKGVKSNPADAGAHYALGIAYFASGDYDKAKEEMRRVQENPKVAGGADYFLGRIARLEGDLEMASQYLHKSVELMPSFSESHTDLARIYMLQGNLKGAQAELNEALRLDPDSFQANNELLVLYRRTHDSRAQKQAELLKKLDEDRSRRAELMLRTIEVRP